jgi:hypothetical protein
MRTAFYSLLIASYAILVKSQLATVTSALSREYSKVSSQDQYIQDSVEKNKRDLDKRSYHLLKNVEPEIPDYKLDTEFSKQYIERSQRRMNRMAKSADENEHI